MGTKNKRVFMSEAKRMRKSKQLFIGMVFIILLVAGWFYPLIGYFIPLCMLAGIGIASRKGRRWCNWMCPRGSFSDSYLKLISVKRRIPVFLRLMPVRTGVIVFLMSMLSYQIVRLWPDPYAIGKLFMTLLTVTTALSIVLALIIHQRTWCYICPIGTISNWVGRNRNPLSAKNDLCTDCKLCGKACPMDLSPYELQKNGGMSFKGDCLKCGLCTNACPKDVLFFRNNRC
jgi:polyferredoxin